MYLFCILSCLSCCSFTLLKSIQQESNNLISLHKGDADESNGNFLRGNRFHVTLSPEIAFKQNLFEMEI